MSKLCAIIGYNYEAIPFWKRNICIYIWKLLLEKLTRLLWLTDWLLKNEIDKQDYGHSYWILSLYFSYCIFSMSIAKLRVSVYVKHISYLFYGCNRIADKNNLREGEFTQAHYLRVQSNMARKSWRQDDEMSDHVASRVLKQRVVDIRAQLHFCLLSILRFQPMEHYNQYLTWVFLPSLT